MMDRLTIRNPYDEACSYGACKDINCSGDCEVCPVNRLIERLAAYEDTGMEPEEIKEMVQNVETRSLAWFYKKFGIGAGRMMDLAEADRDGRLIVLPCKVGDPVWFICEDDAVPDGVYITQDKITEVCTRGFWISGYDDKPDEMGLLFPFDASNTRYGLGKDAFLSQEEAEAALAKMKEENHG